MGGRVTLIHQNRSYRDRETKGKVEEYEWKQRGRWGWGEQQLKINITKKEKKQLIFVWSLAYNLSNLSGPTRNIKVPVNLACQTNKTHNRITLDTNLIRIKCYKQYLLHHLHWGGFRILKI